LLRSRSPRRGRNPPMDTPMESISVDTIHRQNRCEPSRVERSPQRRASRHVESFF
jgi:hypothetical protein